MYLYYNNKNTSSHSTVDRDLFFFDVQTTEKASAANSNAIDATPSDASNTVEMLVKQGFRSLQERYPRGVSVSALTEHVKQYGVSKEQVENVLGDLERKMEIIATDVNVFILNDM